jgi:hypothetical protein
MVVATASGLLQLGAALLTINAGSNWVYVSEGSQGSLWYVDMASLRDEPDPDGKTVRRALIKTQYFAATSTPARDTTRMTLFKCSEQTSKTLSYTEYDGVGQETRTYEFPSPAYDDVIPGTVLASAMAKACSTPPQ